MIGSRFGRYTVIGESNDPRKVKCRCDCGAVKDVNRSSLKRGRSKSCGCLRSEILSTDRAHQLKVGQRFGLLRVVKRVESRGGKSRYAVLCDCGNETVVDGARLVSKHTKSCGCLRKKYTDHSGTVFGRLTVIERNLDTDGPVTYLCECSCGNTTSVRVGHLLGGYVKSCGCALNSSLVEEYLEEYLSLKEYKPLTQYKWADTRHRADIFIPSLSLILEYDGWYYHKDRKEGDLVATELALSLGYKVARIRETNLEFVAAEDRNLYQIGWEYSVKYSGLSAVLDSIIFWAKN